MKRDFKYIIKRVIIGVLTVLVLSFIKSNVFAFTVYSDEYVTIDEEYIFQQFSSVEGFDIQEYPYIYCENYSGGSTKLVSCAAYPQELIDSLYIKSNESSTKQIYTYSLGYNELSHFHFSYSKTQHSMYIAPYKATGSGSPSNSLYKRFYWGFDNTYGYTNFKPSIITNVGSYFDGKMDKLDFSSYLSSPYITIDYLDSSYNSIKSISCSDYVADDFCTLPTNSNVGAFIQVTYNLEQRYGQPIDFLQNDTFKFTTNIIGSNSAVRVYTVNPWFYWGDSTSNIDSELYFPFDNKIYYTGDNYKYQYSFTFNDDYTSYYVYQFVITYKTNGSYFQDITIPMSFSLDNITNGNEPIIPPDTPETEINKDDIIIDQNNQMINNQEETNQKLNEINNTLNDDNVNGANGKGAEFFNDFNDDDHGLSSIIIIPLNLISSITSTQCQTLSLTLPFVNQSFNLPCMTAIYQEHFPTFLSIYQTITFGIVSYWIAVQIYALVKGFKDPENDKIEVVDL